MHPFLSITENYHIGSGYIILPLAGLVGIILTLIEMRRVGEKAKDIYPLLLLLLVFTIYGGRILYCLDFHDEISIRQVLMFWKGGMALYGGAILGFIVFIAYTTCRGLDFWKVGDILAPSVAIFIFIARIGCYLAGCCYGKPCDPNLLLAVTFENSSTVAPIDSPLYPTQLLFAASALMTLIILMARKNNKLFEGELALLCVMLISLTSYIIEFFRGDIKIFYNIVGIELSQNQIISGVFLLVSIALFDYKNRQRKIYIENYEKMIP